MLLDRAGQIICAQGVDQHHQEMMHLGALLAGAYATSHEMARLLKETGFRVLVQEGVREKILPKRSRIAGCWQWCSISRRTWG